jgi:hypothetical protein
VSFDPTSGVPDSRGFVLYPVQLLRRPTVDLVAKAREDAEKKRLSKEQDAKANRKGNRLRGAAEADGEGRGMSDHEDMFGVGAPEAVDDDDGGDDDDDELDSDAEQEALAEEEEAKLPPMVANAETPGHDCVELDLSFPLQWPPKKKKKAKKKKSKGLPAAGRRPGTAAAAADTSESESEDEEAKAAGAPAALEAKAIEEGKEFESAQEAMLREIMEAKAIKEHEAFRTAWGRGGGNTVVENLDVLLILNLLVTQERERDGRRRALAELHAAEADAYAEGVQKQLLELRNQQRLKGGGGRSGAAAAAAEARSTEMTLERARQDAAAAHAIANGEPGAIVVDGEQNKEKGAAPTEALCLRNLRLPAPLAMRALVLPSYAPSVRKLDLRGTGVCGLPFQFISAAVLAAPRLESLRLTGDSEEWKDGFELRPFVFRGMDKEGSCEVEIIGGHDKEGGEPENVPPTEPLDVALVQTFILANKTVKTMNLSDFNCLKCGQQKRRKGDESRERASRERAVERSAVRRASRSIGHVDMLILDHPPSPGSPEVLTPSNERRSSRAGVTFQGDAPMSAVARRASRLASGGLLHSALANASSERPASRAGLDGGGGDSAAGGCRAMRAELHRAYEEDALEMNAASIPDFKKGLFACVLRLLDTSKTLSILVLVNAGITAEQATQLAGVLEGNKTCTQLRLSEANVIQVQDCRGAKGSHVQKLVVLTDSKPRMALTPEERIVACHLLQQNKQLIELHLVGCPLNQTQRLLILAFMQQCKTLERCNLARTGMEAEVSTLGNVLKKMTSLVSLWMTEAWELRVQHLKGVKGENTVVNLSCNDGKRKPPSTEETAIICSLLSANRIVTELRIPGIKLNTLGAKRLLVLLKEAPNLTHADLRGTGFQNVIKGSALSELKSKLQKNMVLKTLRFSNDYTIFVQELAGRVTHKRAVQNSNAGQKFKKFGLKVGRAALTAKAFETKEASEFGKKKALAGKREKTQGGQDIFKMAAEASPGTVIAFSIGTGGMPQAGLEMQLVAAMVQMNTKLHTLHFGALKVWQKGVREHLLSLASKSTALEQINVATSCAKESDLMHLAKAAMSNSDGALMYLHTKHVRLLPGYTSLDVPKQGITTAEAGLIGVALKCNTALTALDLSDNSSIMHGEGSWWGFVMLCEALQKNTTLQKLSLANNSLSGPAPAYDKRVFDALAAMLKVNSSLKSLDLDQTGITAGHKLEGLQVLCEALVVNSGLQHLLMGDTVDELGEIGGEMLLEVAHKSTSLFTISKMPLAQIRLFERLDEGRAQVLKERRRMLAAKASESMAAKASSAAADQVRGH